MIHKIPFTVYFFILFCFSSSIIYAQTIETDYDKYAGKVVSVKVKGGVEYKGRVLEIDKEQLGISTEKTGMVYIKKADIEEISESHSVGSGNYSTDETYATRYFVTPNYLSMEKGSNYGKFSLLGPELQFAFGKHFTFGAMSTWLGSPVAITGKFSFELGKKLHVGFGSFLGWGGILAPDATVAIPFGGFTIGDARANLSITGGFGVTQYSYSSGYPVSSTNYYSGGQPAISLAGMIKSSGGETFVFESVIIPATPGSDYALATFTPGIRFHRKYTRSMQVGLTFFVAEGKLQPYPIPNISWLFQIYQPK